MKFNEATLEQSIIDIDFAIITGEQDLQAMHRHKEDLEHELRTIQLTPPPNAIKNALKRLGMYPKLKLQNRREENDTEKHITEDISFSNLCEGSSPLTNDQSSTGVYPPTPSA